MGFYRGPNIVTDGLVFAVDAGSERSYPGSGTTVSNIIDGSTGTLTNGVGFDSANGGSFTFDGVNDYIATPGNLFGTGGLTISFFANWSNTAGYQVPFDGGYSSNNGILIESNGTTNYIRVYFGTTKVIEEVWNFSNNTWYNFVVTRNGTTVQCYLNGEIFGSPITNSASMNSSNSLIGKYSGGEFFNGKIPNIKIYNEGLIAAQVLQNFNAQKSRFGL